MMRRLTVTVIFLLLGLNLTAPARAGWTDRLPLGPYQSRFFRMKYPLGSSISSQADGYGNTFFRPDPANTRLKDLRIRVLVINFPGDLRDYSQAVANEFKSMNVNGSFDFTTLGSESATRFIYETKDSDKPARTIRVYTLKDGRIFDLQFSCPASRYDDLRPLVERLLSSFIITEAAE